MNSPANEPSSQTQKPSEPSGDPDLSRLVLPHLRNTICTSLTLNSVPPPISLVFWVFLFTKFIENKFGQYARIIFACFPKVSGEEGLMRVPH